MKREVIVRIEKNFILNVDDIAQFDAFQPDYFSFKIIFDFTNATIEDASLVLNLTIFLSFKKKGIEYGYIYNKNTAKDKTLLVLLKAVGLLELLFDEINEPQHNYKSIIPFKKFTTKDIRSFLEMTVRKWLKLLLKDKNADIEPLLTAILEVCNNIKDHTHAEYGLFFANTSHVGKVLNFYISDFGGGIPQKIKSSPLYSHLSDEQAFTKSLEYGVSTAKAKGRGAGLPHLVNTITKYYKGNLFVATGGLGIGFKSGKVVFKDLFSLQLEGTYIAISINIDYIPPRDTSEFIYEPSGDVWNV